MGAGLMRKHTRYRAVCSTCLGMAARGWMDGLWGRGGTSRSGRRLRHGCELFLAGGRSLCCFSGAVNSRSDARRAREQHEHATACDGGVGWSMQWAICDGWYWGARPGWTLIPKTVM